MIRAEGLSFSYPGQHEPVFHQLDLEIRSGEKVAITGPSGSGKTTLLHVLCGLLPLQAGRLWHQDKEYSNASEAIWSRFRNHHLGIVFQNFNLLHQLTALENLQLRLAILGQHRDPQDLVSALSSAALGSLACRKAGELSGGQQQRLACVRATISHPRILMADEPSGNLDDDTTARIASIMFGPTTMTVLVATHDPRLLRHTHRMIDLSGK